MLCQIILLFCIACSICSSQVVELTDDNFDKEFSDGNWLVKFYAPWCGHCKTLKPVFEELSLKTVGNVKIGALDTTQQKIMAKKYDIKRFPTIMYKKGDVVGVYDGLRNLDGLLSFANRMNEPSHIILSDLLDLNKLSAVTENVSFVFSYSTLADPSGAQKAMHTYISVAEQLQNHASFAVYNVDAAVSTGSALHSQLVESVEYLGYSVAKVEKDKPAVFMADTDLLTSEEVTQFVEHNNYPTIVQFDNHNFKRLSHLNKTMVLAIVDYQYRGVADTLVSSLEAVVGSFPREAVSSYVFGHLDGVRWRRFIKEHHAVMGSLLVVDTRHDLHRSYPIDSAASESAVRVVIADVITAVVGGTADLEPSVPPSLLQKIQYRIRDYAPWSYVVLALPFILLALSLLVSYPQDEKIKKH